MPPFDPLRVSGGARRLRRALLRRRRAVAAGLALAAATLAAAGARGAHGPDGGPAVAAPQGAPRPAAGSTTAAGARPAEGSRPAEARPVEGVRSGSRSRPAAELVSAPVRIADAATVRLLRPGDRVDVIASPGLSAGPATGAEPEARVVAQGARVTGVPRFRDPTGETGALVVLSVPRATAAALAGAGASSRLAVTLC
ncbi:RcpC/CpaB family pilus assembly protein [Streptomyces sp. NPDC004609]|uniref:RcpC/CpaB family pilus assembly protein n=1 Tax=Streptomyces sp. NPDC004609 TaxID=3364704 RepID=UPI00368CD6EF